MSVYTDNKPLNLNNGLIFICDLCNNIIKKPFSNCLFLYICLYCIIVMCSWSVLIYLDKTSSQLLWRYLSTDVTTAKSNIEIICL